MDCMALAHIGNTSAAHDPDSRADTTKVTQLEFSFASRRQGNQNFYVLVHVYSSKYCCILRGILLCFIE